MNFSPTVLFTLLALWIIPHIAIIGGVFGRRKAWYLVIVTLTLILAYAIKSGTSDLPKYSVYFDTGMISWIQMGKSPGPDGYQFDDLAAEVRSGDPWAQGYQRSPGFVVLIRWLSNHLPHGPYLPRVFKAKTERGYISDSLVLSIVTLGLSMSMLASWNFVGRILKGRDKGHAVIVSVPIILGSVFFFVGSQNAIRQFLALSFFLLALSFFIKRGSIHYIVALVLMAIGLTLHQWSFAYLCLAIGLILIDYSWKIRHPSILSWLPVLTDYLALLTGIVLVVGLKLLIIFGSDVISYLGFANSNFGYRLSDLISNAAQFAFNDEWTHSYRTSSSTKLIAIGSVLFASEVLLGRTHVGQDPNIRVLRRAAFLMICPLIVFPEIFSRMYYLYLAIEMIYIVWAVSEGTIRSKLSGVFVFCCYGFAPNALNILLGRGEAGQLFENVRYGTWI